MSQTALQEPRLNAPPQKYAGTTAEFAAFKLKYPWVPPLSEYWVSTTNVKYQTADGNAANWIVYITLSQGDFYDYFPSIANTNNDFLLW